MEEGKRDFPFLICHFSLVASLGGATGVDNDLGQSRGLQNRER
jgi:hypothetical protein